MSAGTLSSQSGCSSQENSSHPTSPSLLQSSSRFRVIRLAAGRAEPYRRGRWICKDFLEWEEGAGLRRLMDSMRHAQSLESLDTIGRLPLRKGEGLHVHSHGPIRTEMRPVRGLQPIRRPLLDSNHALSPRLHNIPALLLDAPDQAGPGSPPRPQLGLFHPSPVSRLDRTMFSLPGETSGRSYEFPVMSPPSGRSYHVTSDVGVDLNTIDTKIQQAMDLVKGHLQQAVREELVVLQQQIRDLQDRNNQLQRENYALRSLH